VVVSDGLAAGLDAERAFFASPRLLLVLSPSTHWLAVADPRKEFGLDRGHKVSMGRV
jgi:hypothetical protein